MKKRIRVCALILALIACFVTGAHAADSYLVLYGFAFDINDQGMAVIHDYDERSSDVVIPATLLGAGVVAIDDYAFFGDTGVTSLSFESAASLRSIGAGAFYGCTGLTEIVIPDGIETLSTGSFQNCTSLCTLSVGEGVDVIPTQCFYNCTSLEEVTMCEPLSEIGERAFASCPSLRKVDIPDSVESIAANAFDGCDSVVIYCTKDSYALSYAIENEIDYVITDLVVLTGILGDADNNAIVDARDATFIQRSVALMRVPLEPEMLMQGDVDGNGILEIVDVTFIMRYLVMQQVPYPIGEPISA